MEKGKFHYILLSIISISFVFNLTPVLVLASEDTSGDTLISTAPKMKEDFGSGRNFFDEIIQKIDQEVISPVKQTIENLPQDIANGISHLLERFRGKKEQKQEEIKEEIKQGIKDGIRQGGEKAEKKLLAPLKNKIQQGRDSLVYLINKLKDFIISLFWWRN